MLAALPAGAALAGPARPRADDRGARSTRPSRPRTSDRAARARRSSTEEAADNGGPPPLCVSVRGLRRSRSA